mgnify:CR=1 FL=1
MLPIADSKKDQEPTSTLSKESTKVKNEAQIDSLLSESLKTSTQNFYYSNLLMISLIQACKEDASVATPRLLVLSPSDSNKISIIDLETKEYYAIFDGAKCPGHHCNSRLFKFNLTAAFTVAGWSHVKEIPSTKLLVSLHHSGLKSANMEIFDSSKKERPKKIYSFGEVRGRKIDWVHVHLLK